MSVPPTVENGIFDDNDRIYASKIDYESIGEFCFESDTLALKGNNDYKNVLEAIVILEAQKEQAIKDLNSLHELKEKALADPLDFVERLKNKEDMKMPSAQRIYPVPNIDWGKYALSGDPFTFKKRQLSKIACEVKKNLKRKLRNTIDIQENEMNWSLKEEKQLEELLITLPPQKNQAARWKNIANRLENRTPYEVEVKAFKSFPILAGNSGDNLKKTTIVTRRSSQQSNSKLDNGFQESSKNDEDSLGSKSDVSDDDEIDSELHDTAEYQELLLYKKLLKKRIKSSTMIQHLGFRCAWCKAEPILGIRYHCTDCNPATVDFCEECVGGGYDIDQHTSDHRLEEVHHSNTSFLDRDYMHFLGNDYNYLDPNYMPAT